MNQDFSILKNSRLVPNARALRKNMTKQERELWYRFLSNYKVRFYRQRIVGNYILDFYCHKAKLAIEVDGSQHYLPECKAQDNARTEYLNAIGIEVLRFSNEDVNKRFRDVCEHIHNTITKRLGA